MRKEEFVEYTESKKEFINEVKVYPRELKVKVTTRFITSIIGPRRVGKTYYFYNLAKGERSFVYVNFEDTLFAGCNFKDIIKMVDWYKEVYGVPKLILFDEIQSIKNWEKAVRELYEEKKYNILVTGSSSKLLAKEIATSLRGRAIKYCLLPLSFREFLNFKNFEVGSLYSKEKKIKIKRLFSEFLNYGGFPDVVLEEEFFRKFFESYIDLVVLKDIGERYNVRNLPLLKLFIKKIVSSYSSKFSIHKIFREIKSMNVEVSKKTLYSYLEYLKDSMFAFELNKFSPSLIKRGMSKIYLVDTGIASYYYKEDVGRKLENVIFLELWRKKERDGGELYYFENSKGEIDFVYLGKSKFLINVTREVNSENYRREIAPLVEGKKIFKTKNLIIVTEDQEETITEKNVKIKLIPAWKFLYTSLTNSS